MKTMLRNGALALAVIAGSALVAAPAMADRHHDYHHHWKKEWKHSYNNHNHWNRGYAYRHHYRNYGWGWPGYYGPGFSLYIR